MQNTAGRMAIGEHHGPRIRGSVLIVGIVMAAALLAALLGAMTQRPPVATAAPATPGVTVLTTVWGAADTQGMQRLHVEAVVENTGASAVAAPTAASFTVRGADGRLWPVTVPTDFAPSQSPTLGAGEQRSIDLIADVPAGTRSLTLLMTGVGDTRSVPIS
jgi:hypothetical protein